MPRLSFPVSPGVLVGYGHHSLSAPLVGAFGYPGVDGARRPLHLRTYAVR